MDKKIKNALLDIAAEIIVSPLAAYAKLHELKGKFDESETGKKTNAALKQAGADISEAAKTFADSQTGTMVKDTAMKTGETLQEAAQKVADSEAAKKVVETAHKVAESETAQKIKEQLSAPDRDFDTLSTFGVLPGGTKVSEAPEMLFARKDLKDVLEKAAEITRKQKAEFEETQKKAEAVEMYEILSQTIEEEAKQ